MELIEVSLSKILQTKTYTAVILNAAHKKFSIYMEPSVGHLAQELFSNNKSLRPQTFDLICRIFVGTDMSLERVNIYKFQNKTFYAKILLKQRQEELTHYIEIDARPSDSLLLALRYNVPIYCCSEVVEEMVPYQEPEDQ